MTEVLETEVLEKIYKHFPDEDDPDETMGMLITDCIETGIDYWNTKWPEVEGESEFYSENVWTALKSGETLIFGDETETGELNLKSILKSLNKLKKNDPDVYEDIQSALWDACSCDTFFQTAVFGEVIFG